MGDIFEREEERGDSARLYKFINFRGEGRCMISKRPGLQIAKMQIKIFSSEHRKKKRTGKRLSTVVPRKSATRSGSQCVLVRELKNNYNNCQHDPDEQALY